MTERWWKERPDADGLEPARLMELRPSLDAAGSVRLDLDAFPGTPGAADATPGTSHPWPHPWAAPEAGDAHAVSLRRRLGLVLQPPLENWLAPDCVLDWPHPFPEYQQAGIRALVVRDTLLLADDMGLGKTVQALAALRILFHQRRAAAALLVVPSGLITQWQRAAREWAPELRVSTVNGGAADRAWQWNAPAHLYLTSFDTLRADFTDNPGSPPRRRVWDV
ncbi:MAG TPA: SNF2-related protein, partial [Longimicrobium sp.]|nr:SNF2-related protein [Longimicrobium sp.]